MLDLKIEHYSKDSCYGASYILNYENSKIEGDFCIRTPRTEKAFIDTIDSVNGKFARQKINKDKDAFWKERVEHKDLKLNICVYEEIAISDKEKSRQICQKGEVIKTISLAVSKSKIDEVNLLTVVPVSSIAICP